MSSSPSELTPVLSARQSKLVELLATGRTAEQAGAELNMTARTVRRWKNDPAVNAALMTAQREQMRAVVAVLRSTAHKAALKVAALMDDANPTVALQACKINMDAGLKYIELHELAERLAILERQDAQRQRDMDALRNEVSREAVA